jgi:hypothetical protein
MIRVFCESVFSLYLGMADLEGWAQALAARTNGPAQRYAFPCFKPARKGHR